jgi:hypothetical protein
MGYRGNIFLSVLLVFSSRLSYADNDFSAAFDEALQIEECQAAPTTQTYVGFQDHTYFDITIDKSSKKLDATGRVPAKKLLISIMVGLNFKLDALGNLSVTILGFTNNLNCSVKDDVDTCLAKIEKTLKYLENKESQIIYYSDTDLITKRNTFTCFRTIVQNIHDAI